MEIHRDEILREGEMAASDSETGGIVPHSTLKIPMRLLGRTVKQTRDALNKLSPGQVLAVNTNDP